MKDRFFQNPIFVESRPRLVQEIAGLNEALDFLHDWPEELRDIIHSAALRACQKAYASEYPIEAAFQAFVGFAKSANILAVVDAPLLLATSPVGHEEGVPA
ncbi:DUF982 domain-containing protein [Kumtagia ephedrae]|uniref:DUF982 domain-containing protein n=1 Tax=Kumtagia ephedrae TaxID=2116701 RepID=A0A2P7S108_9HYPH|nr:DUF982 domain-containing protein [Mesorhizobium ephedrae]PSJ56148.1 DUF982 domain-containing protein [Mesorhizobium ephedrae]